MKNLLLLLLLFAGCKEHKSSAQRMVQEPAPVLYPRGATIETRFNPPAGFVRQPSPAAGYSYFLRHLSLKPEGAMVHYFDGRVKANPGIYAAVLDLDIGTKDLQQCADAVMRIRAEYLFANGRGDEISFNFTNGFRADFSHWREGYRIAFSGNTCRWIKSAAAVKEHKTLREYLDLVYNYAGTQSLSRQLKAVSFTDMQPGDVFIVGGSPGHAITVMDMAVNKVGRKVYMLSQSYMPAQDIQVLQNPSNKSISPWYELDESLVTIHTPQWDFTTQQLRRFP